MRCEITNAERTGLKAELSVIAENKPGSVYFADFAVKQVNQVVNADFIQAGNFFGI
mgnify:CR=1 FL=1